MGSVNRVAWPHHFRVGWRLPQCGTRQPLLWCRGRQCAMSGRGLVARSPFFGNEWRRSGDRLRLTFDPSQPILWSNVDQKLRRGTSRTPTGHARSSYPANSHVGTTAWARDRSCDSGAVPKHVSRRSQLVVPSASTSRSAWVDTRRMGYVNYQPKGTVLRVNDGRPQAAHYRDSPVASLGLCNRTHSRSRGGLN